MKVLWAAFAFATAACAQFEPGAVVAGTITNQQGGAPVGQAEVTLYRVDVRPSQQQQQPLSTRTDAEGRYLFPAVASGHYRVVAGGDGFEQISYGARAAGQPGRLLLLGPNETMLDADIALRPTGTVEGLVVSEGQPLRNAQVALLYPVYERGKARYVPMMQTLTDERGRYRMAGIRAGSYRVAAMGPLDRAPQPANGRPRIFARQFYPQAARLENAEVLRLTPGKRFANIDFQLPVETAVRLQGRVVPPPGIEIGGPVAVTLMEDGMDSVTGVSAQPPDFAVAADFLRPGKYLVTANARTAGRSYHGSGHAALGPEGLEGFTLPLEVPVDLKGQVKFDGEGTVRFQVQAVPAGAAPMPVLLPPAAAGADGSFVLMGVPPGEWNLEVRPMPRGAYLKSVRFGEDEVLGKSLKVTGGSAQPLHIAVSMKGATLDGEVDIPQSHIGLEASVLLAPVGARREMLSLYQLRGINTEGQFQMAGIAPGQYRVFAFAELNHRAYQDPSFLLPFLENGVPVEFKEGEEVVLPKRVPLIPPGVIPLD